MAINVICPGCHARFQVSDQFAGKKGPCPKCKAEITIPSPDDEVVIHAPDEFGPKDSSGRATLKPIFKEYTKFSPVIAASAGAGFFTVLICAMVVRVQYADNIENVPLWILGLGALAIAPPLVWTAYAFLRDDELQPHKGSSLWIRVAICSAVYAILWGVICFINWYSFDNEGFPTIMMAVFIPLMIAGGAATAFASLDLEFITGLFHYGVYLGACILLRLLIGIPAFPMEQ